MPDSILTRYRDWAGTDKRSRGGLAIYIRNNLSVVDVCGSDLYEVISVTILLPSGHPCRDFHASYHIESLHLYSVFAIILEASDYQPSPKHSYNSCYVARAFEKIAYHCHARETIKSHFNTLQLLYRIGGNFTDAFLSLQHRIHS
ncbi:hypothetical protein P5673_006754 [Acropora cervicornis]|uniref:Uncharacterized protein n=1 Tax=Acropora cervicornis TaxID=6130 RepID=A0AAD9QX86_ACRCE|nr:hypothetical protein P5673_006754 [Acropora cervicornis]